MTQTSAASSAQRPDVATVIPHFQRRRGLLPQAVRSVFAQTVAERAMVVICDDESPVPAEDEIGDCPDLPRDRILIIRQKNGGAGAARNNALNHVPPGTRYVAFLDSDDVWRPQHLERALAALERGFDAYFSDFVAVGYPGVGNIERIGTLKPEDNPLVDAAHRLHALGVSALEHTVSDGGGVIGTSAVVYRFDKFPELRFREEFYNGQDFFFWMDLGELGAKYVYTYDVLCDAGEGINIYQASGWGSEKSLQRLRNELFVWTSVERFYKLTPQLLQANRATIRNLQESFGRDMLHRLRHRKPIHAQLVKDILRMAPDTPWAAARGVAKAVFSRLRR